MLIGVVVRVVAVAVLSIDVDGGELTDDDTAAEGDTIPENPVVEAMVAELSGLAIAVSDATSEKTKIEVPPSC